MKTLLELLETERCPIDALIYRKKYAAFISFTFHENLIQDLVYLKAKDEPTKTKAKMKSWVSDKQYVQECSASVVRESTNT